MTFHMGVFLKEPLGLLVWNSVLLEWALHGLVFLRDFVSPDSGKYQNSLSEQGFASLDSSKEETRLFLDQEVNDQLFS